MQYVEKGKALTKPRTVLGTSLPKRPIVIRLLSSAQSLNDFSPRSHSTT